MVENITRPTDDDVEVFIKKVNSKKKQEDSFKLLEIMKEISKEEAVMWGPSIIGFGKYHYKYKTGREGDTMKVGFSPRKQAFSLYVRGALEKYSDLFEKFGKFKHGKSCIYINKLEDIDLNVLKQIIQRSMEIEEIVSEKR